MKQLVLLLSLFLLVTPASAQTGAIVSATVEIFNQGAPAPFTSNTFTVTPASCNQTKAVAPPQVLNPTRLAYDDPANPTTRDCIFDQTTFLAGLPVIPGQYTSTVKVTDDRGLMSPRSATSNPFGRTATPPAPTGVRIIP